LGLGFKGHDLSGKTSSRCRQSPAAAAFRSSGEVRGSAKFAVEENEMKSLLVRLWNEQEGQDLTEYALLLVLLSLAAIASLSTLATAINSVFSSASTNLTATT
jgi:pilus assembly protein Flp/PilA